MNRLKGLQDLVLRVILVFSWLAVILLIVGLIGNLFNLAVMNGELWNVFGLIIGVLFSLGFLHVVLTLNIISNSIAVYSNSDESRPIGRVLDLRKIAAASAVVIVVLLGIQFIVNFKMNEKNITVLKQEVSELSQSSITEKLVDEIGQDVKMKDFYFTRDTLLLSTKNRSVTLLVPKLREGNKVFYVVGPLDYDSKDDRKISEVLQRLYIPGKDEKAKFDKMLKDRKSFEIKNNSEITVFQPIEKNGEIKLILVMGTRSEINYEYLKDRSSVVIENTEVKPEAKPKK